MKIIPVIGLEFHTEVKSNTKVFSPSRNSYSKKSNQNVSAIDMAFPGTLPILNKECVRKALMMSMILNCKQPEYMEFDRKNYFYPDLPKGYQITQFFNPVGVNGYINIEVNGKVKEVLIHDIHLEEDTASLDHYTNFSTIDYNRAGVPLLELVTEPCLNSTEEVLSFLETIKSIYEYTDISECDSKKGQFRCDVNVSIMEEGSKELGTKVEVKNVNSFAGVIDTINYEIKRQTELMEKGEYNKVVQETRRYDEETSSTIHMRSKVDAIDYKYFTEPNIPRYKITDSLLESIRASIPVLASERKNKYINEYNLSEYDASVLVKNKKVSDYFEECVNNNCNPKSACNYITTRLLGELNKGEEDIDTIFIRPHHICELINLIENKKISSEQGKKVFTLMLEEKLSPLELVKKYEMEVIEDDNFLNTLIEEVVSENAKAIEDYNNGRTNMLDYLVGQVMKKSKGKVNPMEAKNKMLERIKQ